MKVKDHMLTGEEFFLEYDPELQLYRTNPVPANLDSYYDSEEYISHTDRKSGLKEWVYYRVKQVQFVQKRSRMLRYVSEGSEVFDVGTGTGDWPAYLQSKGHKVLGLETNEGAREKANQKGVHTVVSWEELQEQQFDCISLWHVLEHVPDPSQTLKLIFDHLKPGGIVMIAVPNYRSWDAKFYNEFWAAYDVPRHLWHFSSESIRSLGRTSGLQWSKKFPMWFDAFYVSLLSESYKKRGNPIRAIGVGLYSTLSAMFTKEYSSMLYVLKKP